MTRRYTDEAVKFIKANREKPFFLYLPHTSVHLPLFPGEDFKGKSANGKYGDWIEEVDACTGIILQTLKDEKLDQNTLVIFTLRQRLQWRKRIGSNAPLKGAKGSTHEGGMRVACVMRWPDKIPRQLHLFGSRLHSRHPPYLRRSSRNNSFTGSKNRWTQHQRSHSWDARS